MNFPNHLKRDATSVNLKQVALHEFEILQKMAKEIWQSHYIPIIGQAQVDYMLGKMYDIASLTRQREEENHQFYWIYFNDKLSGFISLSFPEPDFLFIHKFYIKIQSQGLGIGKQVMNLIKEEFSEINQMRLTVNRQNYTAINFYFKNKFIIEKVADFDIGQGYQMNDFVMLWRRKV
ncbi:MAG: GNAT family N-acetyltransferase [Chitinophagales bacterium]|jgi:ribosomal protein S18 acetylase RimI-like enzyme|nr:GNAT family N-acetyltransferase [Chitinophagales bacterium]